MNPHNVATYIKKGFGMGLLSKFDEALSYFDQAEDIDPIQFCNMSYHGSITFSQNKRSRFK